MSNIIKKYERINKVKTQQLLKSLDERKDIDWAYIAGWIDGDGSVGSYNKKRYGFSLRIADKEPVEMLSTLFLCSVSQEKMDPRPIFLKPPKKRYYVTIRGQRGLFLAKKIAPFIMEKTKNLYKTLESFGCYEKFPYMELNDKDFLSYLVGFSEAEGSFTYNKEKSLYSYTLVNTNLNLLKYLEKRLKQLNFFKFKIRFMTKKGFYFFNKKATDRVIKRKNSYRLEMSGYALLDFYNLIKDRLIIDRKKQKVLATIEHYKNYRGVSYNNYMKAKMAL